MRIDRVHAPASVVVGEIVDYRDVVRQPIRLDEAAAEEDARLRTGLREAGAALTGEVEAFKDGMVRGGEHDHPVSVLAGGGAVDSDLAGLAHSFEVDVLAVAAGGTAFKGETRVDTRHDGDEIAAPGSVGGLLQGRERRGDRIGCLGRRMLPCR